MSESIKENEPKKYPKFEEGHSYGTTVDSEGNLVNFETLYDGDNFNPDLNIPIEPIEPKKKGD